jgi:hypothetical protein
MNPNVKRAIMVAAVIIVPGGIALGAWYMIRRRGTRPAWMAGLVGAVGQSGEAAAAELATRNGVGLNVEALARMMASEGRKEVDMIARGWVAINDARKTTGGNVFRVITLRRDWTGIGTGGKRVTQKRSGFFGEQSSGGRYSTSKPSTPATRALADKLLRGIIPDPTGGATRFVDAGAFGKQRGTRTFAAVDAAWQAEGFRRRQIPGAKSDFFVYSKTG